MASAAGEGGRASRTLAHDARAPEVRASWHNLQPANLEPEILGPRSTRRVADSPGRVFSTGGGSKPARGEHFAPLPASPRFGWASRWEELAIDYEALPADGSLPRERTCMSGRGRAGEGQPQRGFATVARGFSRGRGRLGVRRAHDVRARSTRRVTDSPGHVFLTEELAIDYEALPADDSLPRE